jgi:hypothetical protein
VRLCHRTGVLLSIRRTLELPVIFSLFECGLCRKRNEELKHPRRIRTNKPVTLSRRKPSEEWTRTALSSWASGGVDYRSKTLEMLLKSSEENNERRPSLGTVT